MGSGVSKTAEDVVIQIVEAIQTNDTTALKTTLNHVFGNIAALQKEHTALKAELDELKKQKQSDTATVRLTVPSTVEHPDLKDDQGRPALGIKTLTEKEHEERLDQIQKQAGFTGANGALGKAGVQGTLVRLGVA